MKPSLKKHFESLYNYHVLSIEKVVDGDTVYAVIDTGFNNRYFAKLRLENIDTPEINSRDPQQKAWAYDCKDHLIQLLQAWKDDASIILMKSSKLGKYGRPIGNLYAFNPANSDNPYVMTEDIVSSMIQYMNNQGIVKS